MELAEWLPEIYVDADGVPEVMALNALRRSVRELCQKTHAWTDFVDAIRPSAGTREYDVYPPFGSEVIRYLRAEHQGVEVPFASWQDLDAGWHRQTGIGIEAVIPGRQSIAIYPTPDDTSDEDLTILVALAPTMKADRAGDVLEQWREGLIAGALARLKAQPEKPWEDRSGVPYYAELFQSAINDAWMTGQYGLTDNDLTVIPE